MWQQSFKWSNLYECNMRASHHRMYSGFQNQSRLVVIIRTPHRHHKWQLQWFIDLRVLNEQQHLNKTWKCFLQPMPGFSVSGATSAHLKSFCSVKMRWSAGSMRWSSKRWAASSLMIRAELQGVTSIDSQALEALLSWESTYLSARSWHC